MNRLTSEYLQSCPSCLQFKSENQLLMENLQSIPVGDQAVHWGLDILVPYDVSKKRNRYVLTAVDYGSRFCISKAIGDANMQQFIRFLEEQFVWRFLMPFQIEGRSSCQQSSKIS